MYVTFFINWFVSVITCDSKHFSRLHYLHDNVEHFRTEIHLQQMEY